MSNDSTLDAIESITVYVMELRERVDALASDPDANPLERIEALEELVAALDARYETSHGFTRDMLPILGVHYHQFVRLENAERFARWAIETTRKGSRPCRATVYANDFGTGYEVRVANW